MAGLLGRVGFLALVLAFLAGASYVYDRIANVNDRNDAQGTATYEYQTLINLYI